MDHVNRVVKNTFFLYVKMFITIFMSLYATRIVLDTLGANDFGIFNLIVGLIAMLNFFNTAMTLSSQRFMSYAKGKGNFNEEVSIFNISILLHFSIGVFLVIILSISGAYLIDSVLTIAPDKIDTAKLIFDFMIAGMFFTVLSVPYDAVINAHEDMHIVAILGVMESLLKFGAAILITMFFEDKLAFYGFLIASIAFLNMTAKIILGHVKYLEVKLSISEYFDKKLFMKMRDFALLTFAGTFTQMVSNYGQGVVLNVFFGTVVNAAQGIVAQVSGQLGAFAVTMLKALNPMITKSEGSGNRQLMIGASMKGSRLSFYLLIFFYVPFLLETQTIFDLWLVDVPEYTIVFCKLLLIRNLIEQLFVTLTTSIASVGNIKEFQIYNSILNILPLVVSYFLFKAGLPPATMYMIFIVYSLMQGALYLYFAKKECHMSIKSYIDNVILRSLIVFLMIFFIALIPHYFIDNEYIRLLLLCLLHGITFFIVIWYVGLLQDEREYALKIIVSKLRK